MLKFLKYYLSKNIFRNIRNSLLIKPTFSLKPIQSETTISDYFYWKEDKNFSTKFMLTNLSSQSYPEANEIDYVHIFIFNHYGKKIKLKVIELKPFETYELFFNSFNIKGHGSFFVFHKFNKLNEITMNNTYMAERGYVGYKSENGVWNFMHGNQYAAYLNNSNQIKSILASSIFNFTYLPQVSFLDCIQASIIFNNPSNKIIKYNIISYDKNDLIIDKSVHIIKEYETLHIDIIANTAYINCVSKLLLTRPIIIKQYKTYFDIFHG